MAVRILSGPSGESVAEANIEFDASTAMTTSMPSLTVFWSLTPPHGRAKAMMIRVRARSPTIIFSGGLYGDTSGIRLEITPGLPNFLRLRRRVYRDHT